jgi:uncharacterized membrane protein (UPF0127 family)
MNRPPNRFRREVISVSRGEERWNPREVGRALDLPQVAGPVDATKLERMRSGALATEDGQVVCEACVLADTAWTRLRGLLGRRTLPRGEGLLLRPAPSIHTCFMRFPVDVVFVDAQLRVLRVVERLAPWRVAGCRGAHGAIELAAGEASARGLSVGIRLALS